MLLELAATSASREDITGLQRTDLFLRSVHLFVQVVQLGLDPSQLDDNRPLDSSCLYELLFLLPNVPLDLVVILAHISGVGN